MKILLYRCLLLAGLFAICSRALAQGGPPLITDDPATVEPRHFEINVALTAEHRPGVREFEMPLVDINYGYNGRTQLKWEVPWVVADEGGSAKGGLGNSNFGVKWRFRDEDKRVPAFSTYPQLIVNNPGSSVRRGLVEGGTSLFLPVQIQKGFHGFSLNADAGYQFNSGGPDIWSWGMAVGRDVSSCLEVLAEIHGESQRGDQDLVINLGGRYRLAPGRTLLLSAGRSVGRISDEPVSLLAYAGIQFAF